MWAGHAARTVAGQPFALMVYESLPDISPYTEFFTQRLGRPRALGQFRRVRVYAFEKLPESAE